MELLCTVLTYSRPTFLIRLHDTARVEDGVIAVGEYTITIHDTVHAHSEVSPHKTSQLPGTISGVANDQSNLQDFVHAIEALGWEITFKSSY